LIRLGILRIGSIVRANLSIVALFGSYLSFQFMMTLYLQDVLRWSPLKMAMALLPAGLLVAFGSPFVGRLIDRYGTPRLIISSMTSLSLGYGWFLATAGNAPHYAFTILPTMLLLGGGFAFGFSSIMAQATDGIDDSEQGL
ncbi:MFS transporter, partial [Micromonospora aurantiaca]|nr:MFS transporter [Micromonospora aurantiaca]